MDLRKTAEVKWPGREELTVEVELNEQGFIQSAQVRGIGGPAFLQMVQDLRLNLPGHQLKNLKMPSGVSREDICVREAILKLKGEWDFPYKEEELCHCRAVPAAVVDQAICAGAHSPKKVSQWTSASTACGTCRPDVQAIIEYRLAKK